MEKNQIDSDTVESIGHSTKAMRKTVHTMGEQAQEQFQTTSREVTSTATEVMSQLSKQKEQSDTM